MFPLLRKSLIISFAILLVSLLLAACSSSTAPASKDPNSEQKSEPASGNESNANKKTAIRIGTSSSGSPFYTLAVGMSEIINKYAPSLNATAEPVGGSDPNVFALEANKVDFAVINSLAAFNGYYAKAPFENPVDVRLVAQGQATFRQIIVRKDSGIKSISDLVGKKIIAKRPALPEIEQIANALIEVYQLPKDDIKLISTVDTPEALEALKIGSVDAAIVPASLKAANLTELFSGGDFAFLSVDADKMDQILNLLPKAIVPGVIPENTYPEQTEKANAFKFNTYLVTKGDVSEEVVYNVTKTFFDKSDEFAAVHATAKKWTIDNTLEGPSIPFHPGAIRYYKEIGKWDSKLDDLQASLEKR
jgi:TRAP transporter TAXI family solute receptor